MPQVPFEDLMEHVDSKYRLVIIASKRAKQLNRGAASLIQARSHKPTYQALDEMAAGKLGYEMEALAGEPSGEVTGPGAKPTWFRSLSAEEVVPEEVAVETEEEFEEEPPAEAPVAETGGAEDLLMNEFEEEGLEELGEINTLEHEEGEE
jgi:DNA-directed RNA polymerase subunit omega